MPSYILEITTSINFDFNEKLISGWGSGSHVKHLPNKCEILSSNPSATKIKFFHLLVICYTIWRIIPYVII
jgi:hypothetical protein